MHIGHLDIMKQAEIYIEKQGLTLIKGFIIPCHPKYLYRKLGKDAIPYRTRDKMIRLSI